MIFFTKRERQVLECLLANDVASPAMMLSYMYPPDYRSSNSRYRPDRYTLRTFVSLTRTKLAPYGIFIQCARRLEDYEGGYFLTPDSRDKLKQLAPWLIPKKEVA